MDGKFACHDKYLSKVQYYILGLDSSLESWEKLKNWIKLTG